MYHFIVKKLVKHSFEELSRGNYHAATALMASDCRYNFIGQHALGGERNRRTLIALWFERFFRVLPNFKFEPTEILVNGWPWNTKVAVRLEVSWQRPDGGVYKNTALQMVTLKWGKAKEIITIDDTARFGALLQEVGRRYGLKEALAAPIVN